MIKPYILGIEGLELKDIERELFRDAPPFGVILFLRNIDNPDQLRRLVDDIKLTTNHNTLIFIDQEGGRVQRLVPPYWTQFPIAANLDEKEGQEFQDAVYALYRLISDELSEAGIDANCAPCLDLRTDETATFLQERTFGASKSRVIEAGHAAVNAMNDASIAPVIKHLPGHGRGTVDSHLELPRVVFEQNPYETAPDDVKIFQEKYDVQMAMNAHILYPQIDEKFPLTLSPKGIDFIRNIVGYQGLIMSDDLAMKALNGTQGELAKRAFDAGLDVALSCSGETDEIKEIYALKIEANALTKSTHEKLKSTAMNKADLLDEASKAAYKIQLGLA